MQPDYIFYTITDTYIKTLGEFIDQSPAPLIITGIKTNIQERCKVFLDITFEGKSNDDRIYISYMQQSEVDAYKKAVSLGNYQDIPIITNTTIVLDSFYKNLEFLAIAGKNQIVEYSTFNSFYAPILEDLYLDENYTPILRLGGFGKDNENPKVITKNISCSVWLWSRTNYDEGEFIDVTRFVSSMNTTISKNGGAFDLTFNDIIGNEWDDVRKIDKVAQSSFFRKEGIKLIRNNFAFHKLVKTNDLVWLRFEQLNNENPNSRYISDKNIKELSPLEIPGNIYDMIGLVDENNISYNSSSLDAVTIVSGRDLSKMLIEDGSYYSDFQLNNENFNINIQDKSKILKRTFNQYYSMVFAFPSIRQSLQFMMNNLQHTGIVPNSVFSQYENKVKIYKLGLNIDESFTEEDAPGVWGITKLVIDESVANITLFDSSIAQADGSILNQIRKVCQEPFVEFFTDTYGDKFYLIARRPPFTLEAIKAAIKDGLVIDIDESNIINDNFSFNEDEAYTWFQMRGQFQMILPSVYLEEFIEVWGTRLFSISTNYSFYDPTYAKQNSQKDDEAPMFQQVTINDFMYILKSYFYLPFTRKGSITINGDRRIKKGTFIRYKSTGEIFYVDAVNNSINFSESNVDRTTSLQVSRGLVENFIKGISIGTDVNISSLKEYSYEKIINFDDISEQLVSFATKGKTQKTQTPTNLSVNRDMFNFFLQHKQFD